MPKPRVNDDSKLLTHQRSWSGTSARGHNESIQEKTPGEGHAPATVSNYRNDGVGASMPLSENIENYLEHILRICKRNGQATPGAIARNLGIAPPSVTQMLAKLEKQGFVKRPAGRNVELTETGYLRALDTLKKHTLAERFLEEIVGMSHDRAHAWGCRMEHVLPPELERWLYDQLQPRENEDDRQKPHDPHVSPSRAPVEERARGPGPAGP